jgi:hypothetical protein
VSHAAAYDSCESAPVVGPGSQMTLGMSGRAEGAGCCCSPLTCRKTCPQLSRFVMSQCGSHFNTDQGTGSSEDNALDLTHRLRRGLIAHPNSGARKAGLTTEAQGACRGRLVSVNHVYKIDCYNLEKSVKCERHLLRERDLYPSTAPSKGRRRTANPSSGPVTVRGRMPW